MVNKELYYIGLLLFSALLGALIGLERERFGGLAGIRTYAAVSLGSCLFGLLSSETSGDPSRISAQIVSGIGFLGAGVIIRDRGSVKGLTTAATLWATASIGLAVSLGMYITAVGSTVVIFGLLSLHRVPGWLSWKFKNREDVEVSEE